MHSDGNGGTHWHVAATNGRNYYASGPAIYHDPCPSYNGVYGLINNTNGNGYRKPIINTPVKSSDNTLKSISINGNYITVSDNMTHTTNIKKSNIEILPNDRKAKIEFINRDLIFGDNNFKIKVIAENGNIKEYNLNINKTKDDGKNSLLELVINNNNMLLKDEMIYEKDINIKDIDITYKLFKNNGKLNIYKNDLLVDKLIDIKDNDIIKLVVLDENDNEYVYKITVKDKIEKKKIKQILHL